MRGNAWQITAIIAIILVVVLIIPLVIMGRDHQTLSEQTKQAKKEQSDAAQKAATLEGEVKTLKTLMAGTEAATLDDMRKQHAEVVEKALPGENDSTRSYHDTVATLLGDLERERELHRKTNEEKAQLESDFSNAQKSHESVVKQIRDKLAETERDRDAVQRRFLVTKEESDRQLRIAQDQQNATLARSERVKHELNEQAQQLANANRDIRESNAHLAGMLEDIRNPNVEHPAGKIISVDQQAGSAVINLGDEDGLRVRTMFSVYHSSITGLSFRTAPVGREAVYCDVCRREIARDVSKASIEVMQILGPHKARVRILDDVLTDPIMVGDVVYSPIWKPGQNLRFALTAGMHLPGSSIESGTEAIKRLIEMNGGIVDCWIDTTVDEGEECLQGSISDFTNFIVVNERAARALEPEAARVQQALVESAKNRAIKAISLEDLLSRMGWKNMALVHTFGEPTYTPEMRVVPEHQGAVRQSPGVVSPRFTPDNAATRVNAREANPVRNSSGIVSPLFDDKAPPPPSSSGKTSDLFRPRSPI
jgi:hypothetical protein